MHLPFRTDFDLIKKYRFKSIFWVYFKYIFFVVLIPVIIISLFVTSYYSRNSKNEFDNIAYDKFRFASDAVESAFKEIDSAHFQLADSDDVIEYAVQLNESHAPKVYNQLLRLVMYGRYLENIHVYFPNQEFIISNNETNSLYKHTKRSLFNPPIENDNYKYTKNNKKNNILHYAHPIYLTPTLQLIAVYDIKMYEIIQPFDEGTEVYIAKKDTKEIIYTNVDTQNKFITEDYLLESLKSPNKIISSETSACFSTQIYNGEYYFIGNAVRKNHETSKPTIILALIALGIITILIPLLVAFYFSSRLYSSITELTSAFGGYIETPDTNANELIFLSNNISTALEKNKLIENQLTSNMQNLKLLQSQALQMQISPHFVFNTLNLANVIIMRELKRSNDAEKVISHLANLMSVALDTKNTIITVSEELKYIDEFIEIEKIRFKNKFDVIYEISPEVYQKNIIKFTLQPILENAFEYGIKPLRETRGIINLKAWIEENDTYITISNNGKALDEETLEKLRNNINSPQPPEKHIGLYNVNKRIRLMCGEKYGISITSTAPDITSVTLKFKF